MALALARVLRAHVLPQLGLHSGRAHTRAGSGGDVTFAIDAEAEGLLERFLQENAPEVAFFSEDRGLVLPTGDSGFSLAGKTGSSEGPGWVSGWVLVVDPIDGTRPAMAGLESCCVSVAAAKSAGDLEPTMADVRIGCIVEIKTGATFMAERGLGIELYDAAGRETKPLLSANSDLRSLFWSTGFRGRPAAPLIAVLGDLIDVSSVGGGFFDLGSATFDMTRIVTGQLDAYLDVGSLMIETMPELRSRFEQVGDGAVLNNSPYDLAAAVLCLEEAGAVVTDARGESLDPRPLLGSGHEFQMSCLAAANARLHSRLLGVVEQGIDGLLSRST